MHSVMAPGGNALVPPPSVPVEQSPLELKPQRDLVSKTPRKTKLCVVAGQCYERTMEPYNATVTGIRFIHDELAVFQIQVDGASLAYEPGQFTTLGLLDGEPGVVECLKVDKPAFLHRRAYSISHPVWTGTALAGDGGPLEFYVVLVKEGARGRPPSLTPRLFALKPGARIAVGKIAGHYTLVPEEVIEKRHLLFCGTGTGEAPHCAMIWKLLREGYEGRITLITCVRESRDFGYGDAFDQVARAYPQFQYHRLTTREAGIPKRYIQDFIDSGDLESAMGEKLSPNTHSVYLCGNPAMIGIPKRSPEGELQFPDGRPGVIQLLTERGFTPDFPKNPGNVHFEKYW